MWWLSGIHRDVWLYRKPPAHIADEALAEWLKFFAGHKVPSEES